MKPYTVSGNLICPEFGRGKHESLSALEVLDILAAGGTVIMKPVKQELIDAYDQLNDPGEVLYISPPCDVEPNGCA